MKKKLIISVIALIIATVLGLSSEAIAPTVETVYCKILPQECK